MQDVVLNVGYRTDASDLRWYKSARVRRMTHSAAARERRVIRGHDLATDGQGQTL
jgi:hypothetical protein